MFSLLCSRRMFASRVVLTLLALMLCGWLAPARAESRPHKWRATGQFVSANDFVGEGKATHLGRFREAGSVQFAPTDDPAVLQFEGTNIYTAANGDELHAVISAGRLNLQTGAGAATVIFVGGTGRFADATGTATA